MKKISILTIFLLAFIVEGQQKPDTSWESIKTNLRTLSKNVKKKLANKKAAEIIQADSQETKVDTILVDLNLSDSMNIYYAIKQQIEEESFEMKTNEPKKKPTVVGKFFRSVFRKKKPK